MGQLPGVGLQTSTGVLLLNPVGESFTRSPGFTPAHNRPHLATPLLVQQCDRGHTRLYLLLCVYILVN